MKRSHWISTVATVVIAVMAVLAFNWKTLLGTGPPLEANGESFYAPLSPDIRDMFDFVEGAQEPKLSTVLTDILKGIFDHNNLSFDAAFPGEVAESLSTAVRSKIQVLLKAP